MKLAGMDKSDNSDTYRVLLTDERPMQANVGTGCCIAGCVASTKKKGNVSLADEPLDCAVVDLVSVTPSIDGNPKRGKVAVNQAALIVALDCNLDKEIQRVLDAKKDD